MPFKFSILTFIFISFTCSGFAQQTPCKLIRDKILFTIDGNHFESKGHLKRNNTIEGQFKEWVKDNYGSEFKLDDLPLRRAEQIKSDFVNEQNAILKKSQELLTDLLNQRIESNRFKINSSEPTIRFNGKEYKKEAFLGGMNEGRVHLVSRDNSLVVIKVFEKKKNLLWHQKILNFLQELEIRAVRVLETDLENNSLMLTYEEGLVYSDVRILKMDREQLAPFIRAYQFKYVQFRNKIELKIQEKGKQMPTSPEFIFDPHLDNVVYDPQSGNFSIIDIQ